jgi:hypothetical protein
MRKITAVVVLAALSGCATQRPEAARLGAVSSEPDVATYYDRNQDGVADLEFHDPGCCDRDWALVDTDFNGRYDKRVQWSYALVKAAVDLPVPRNVVLTAGQPPLSGWEN